MKNYELLPPIIKDLIDALRQDDTPIHIRDAYSSRLENVVDCCSEAIEAFRKKQARHYTIRAKQKV
jgi:hypothetical protein